MVCRRRRRLRHVGRMVILAIDPGTKLGWALGRDGRLIESGVEDLSPRRGESKGARFLRFRAWLAGAGMVGWSELKRPDLVIYEMAHHRGGAATEVGVGITTRIQEFAAEHGIECVGIHSATLKKRATGSGRAGKPDMIGRAMALFPTSAAGYEDMTDDEADALCLLWLGFEDYGGSKSTSDPAPA